ncbi:hypothetical protein GCK72_023966 [Caenorhabditis remanei]|uniref:Uncharacterized protein n=1 Tax=Caenorhabditis remanei TaxID=31234 RepID=A0A6A5FYJ0_CAERE|nr:hypothetical protein GCK72_023966 [Caenorhabditis remanei]KAF1747501.1 hypothetical protein GCK72_023966 [Caenorhabditis remanei]
MLVVENTKHDSNANRVSSMDGVSCEDAAKRKKVDQKAEDTVTCPVTVARDQNIFLAQQSTSDQSKWSENKSMRVEEEPRPRKDPPQSIMLNVSDNKTRGVKEEPRSRKDPPDSWMMFNDAWRRTKEEHQPRKDPPLYVTCTTMVIMGIYSDVETREIGGSLQREISSAADWIHLISPATISTNFVLPFQSCIVYLFIS